MGAIRRLETVALWGFLLGVGFSISLAQLALGGWRSPGS